MSVEFKVRISQGIVDEVDLRELYYRNDEENGAGSSIYRRIYEKGKPCVLKVSEAEFKELFDEADYWVPERGPEGYLKAWKALYRQMMKIKEGAN